jgi:ethanolamine utilization cobalamin adenosyltransferase
MSETDLNSNIYVSKNHPRIIFRCALDSLEADILEVQLLAAEKNENYYIAALGEILQFTRELMSAEVNDRPVVMPLLFGFSLDELHQQANTIILPDYTMGAIPVRLNTLRTRVREVELLAVKYFQYREDILYSLNRLSSAVHWIFCQSIKPIAL